MKVRKSKMKRRSRLETKLDILKTILQWPKSEYPVLRLMHDSNVSFMPLQKLLAEIVRSGLLTNTTKDFRHVYSLTPKGRQAIKHFEELSKLIDEPITDPEI